MHELLQRRVLLVAGKGGVGRTTFAAALAQAAAAAGRRTLLADMGGPDPSFLSASARLFGRAAFATTPEPLGAHLHGVLLHGRTGQALFARRILPVPGLVRAALQSRALGRLLDAAPSFQELGVFHHFLSLAEESRGGRPVYDTLVVDLPATGHALAMAALPPILLELIPRGPIAELLRRGQRLLYDPEHAAAVVVTLPEPLPVSEALELARGLDERRVPVAGLVLNKWLEDDLTPAERKALARLPRGRRFLGIERLDAAARAARELPRVAAGFAGDVYTMPELLEEGAALVSALAALVPHLTPRLSTRPRGPTAEAVA